MTNLNTDKKSKTIPDDKTIPDSGQIESQDGGQYLTRRLNGLTIKTRISQ